MLVSIIIPTIGRESLSRSIDSVLEQDISPGMFEIIVVNDGKEPLKEASWQKHPNVRIISTHGKERSIARNTGAAISNGRYLHFLDDDDWLLPGGLRSLLHLATRFDSAFAYGASKLYSEDGKLLANHHIGTAGNIFVKVMAGEWLPIQACIFRSDVFFKSGGFNNNLTVCEDKDLCRKVALRCDAAQIPDSVVAILRRSEVSTTDYTLATEFSIRSRSQIMTMPKAFTRMWASSNSGYWRGRMVRSLLTCVILSLKDRRFSHLPGRIAQAIAAAIISGKDLLGPRFWVALLKPHVREGVF